MRTLNRAAYACLAMLTAALLTSGCGIFDGDDGSNTEQETAAEFMTLTSPENLIYNLVLSYAELNIEEYSKLLLSTEDGDYGKEYIWFNQIEDVGSIGEESYPRDVEITRTSNLFQAAKGTPVKPEHPIINSYQLDIFPGTWAPSDSLWGEPCEDCWYTKRQYYIEIHIGDDTLYCDDYVEFYVVPVLEGDVTTYRIAIAIDVFH